MRDLLGAIRVVAAAVWLAAPAWGAPGAPLVAGLYRGPLGTLRMEYEKSGQLVGRYVAGGLCDFKSQQRVVEGQFEGNVLVAKVVVCQSGPRCAGKALPTLLFVDPVDGSLTGEVSLDKGCSSPAVDGNRISLAFTAGRNGERGTELSPRRAQELAREALIAGQAHLEAKRLDQAAREFETALGYTEKDWQVFLGLGVVDLERGNAARALKRFEQARALTRGARSEKPDIYFNLACAHARLGDRKAAMAALRTSVRLGFDVPDEMERDSGLSGMFGEDPEFKRLMMQVQGRREKTGRRAQGGP